MTAPDESQMAHCRDCAHRLGSGCGCECCDPSALILRAISDPGSITPRRRTCGNCQRVLVDEDEAGWYYQAPVTDPEVPGLTFMDRVHECHGAPHAVDLESMLQWQARAAVQAALPVVRAAAAAEERERLLNGPVAQIEPDPDQPGYNRGVFDVDAAIAQAVAAERERCAALERALRDVLSRFTEHGHPGYAAVRTPWLMTGFVQQWRDLLRDAATTTTTEGNPS